MKILKWIALTIVSLLCVGVICEQGIQLYLNQHRPSEDEFVTINDKAVHFVKKGDGGPTVVFQSGLGSDWKIWKEVQDSLSTFTTTISYDRAGLLWSEPVEGRKTLETIKDELTQLLEKTNCPKPYIVVGHSLAGITLRTFIDAHSGDVAGIVFIDVAHPQQIKRASKELQVYVTVPPKSLISFLVETGIFRIVYSCTPFVTDLPGNHWYNAHVRDYFYRSYATVLQEAHEDDVMFLESEHINSFGEIPLTIITGAYPNGVDFTSDALLKQEYLSLHFNNQTELLALSSNSRQVMAAKSSHFIPLQEPELITGIISN